MNHCRLENTSNCIIVTLGSNDISWELKRWFLHCLLRVIMNTTFLFDDPRNIKRQWWLWSHRFAGEKTKYRAYLHITKLKVFPLPAGKPRPRTEKGNLENEFDPNHFFFMSTQTRYFLFSFMTVSQPLCSIIESRISIHAFFDYSRSITFVSFFLALSSIIFHSSHLGCTFSKHHIFHHLSVKRAL